MNKKKERGNEKDGEKICLFVCFYFPFAFVF